jgi:pimeloyl-ACP methyl ester carboxylesterase
MTTLALIPGLLLTKDLYLAQEPRLAEGHAIHHANTLGMNSITLMAEEVLDETSGMIVPIGLSMGGYVALEIARLAPDRLSGLVVMDSNAEADSAEKKDQRQAFIKMSNLGKFKGVTRTLLPSLIAAKNLDDDSITGPVMAMAEAVGRDHFVLQQTAIMGRQDQFETLRRFDKPSLFVVGEHDALTPPAMARAMADAAPQSRYVEIKDAGHLPPLENPEAVTEALVEFVTSLDG